MQPLLVQELLISLHHAVHLDPDGCKVVVELAGERGVLFRGQNGGRLTQHVGIGVDPALDIGRAGQRSSKAS